MRLWPLPRAVQLSLVLLLALVSLAPSSIGGALIPDAISGSASATTFQLFGQGTSIEGGAFDMMDACGHCWIRMTIDGPGLTVIDATHPDGANRQLGPGQYEIREFRGLFGIHVIGPHDFVLWLDGTGKTIKLS